ncbi:hypothetical protein ACFWM3_08230 [Gottfriedia sp. NPDC058432]|uniref:hypothetical protein n=1 Tax=Gottfriedia sp. NPDC058432 TaxID=3346497 RepID=UPI0036609AF9
MMVHATDPYKLYSKAFEVNGSGLNYSDSTVYYVKVTAVHEDGANPISHATSSTFLEAISSEEEGSFESIPTLKEMTPEQLEVSNAALKN